MERNRAPDPLAYLLMVSLTDYWSFHSGRHDVIEDPRYFCDHCQQDHPVKTSRRGENGSIQLPQQYSDKLSDLPGHLLEATPSKRWSGQQLLTYLESEAPQMIQAHFMALRPWAISSAH